MVDDASIAVGRTSGMTPIVTLILWWGIVPRGIGPERDRGTWVYHCHILTHVERSDGMFGMVTAIIVNPADDA